MWIWIAATSLGLPFLASAQSDGSSGAVPAAKSVSSLDPPPSDSNPPQTGEATSAEAAGESPAERENAEVRKRLYHPNDVQIGSAFFTDSSGNRSVRSFEQLHYQIRSGLTANFQLDEREFWDALHDAGTMWAFGVDAGYRVRHYLTVDAGGGRVRYGAGSEHTTAKAQAELHPLRQLWVSGGYLRTPIAPTAQADALGLLAEGWRTRADWISPQWRIFATFSREHYTDSNLAWKRGVEAIRWFGWESFKLGPGYSHEHDDFRYVLHDGYFSPGNYDRHLGIAAMRVSGWKGHFLGEYVAKMGQETIDDVRDRYAWEMAVRNRLHFSRWSLDADYTFLHLAQATGAFRAHVPVLQLIYHF